MGPASLSSSPNRWVRDFRWGALVWLSGGSILGSSGIVSLSSRLSRQTHPEKMRTYAATSQPQLSAVLLEQGCDGWVAVGREARGAPRTNIVQHQRGKPC